ncbi:glycine zipper family protein [Alloalcanivorax mobilis]|uniref:glycine zipper family protein n=1 Tax=Alloalcanivorax mobilis TaxID=2019569 RepID=UPI001E49D8B4|nr:glycine zipper family protein [Alloalcanivorax mobilis]|tara:strand:+ start:6115 stop:6483 length:369 start_codon:yes stop_codon:yes gene_type:complete
MMRHLLPCTALFAGLLLSACASTDRVIVDQKGVDPAQYQQDLNECQQVADQVGTGRDATEGAVGGAVIGGLLGAIFGNSSTAGMGAGAGAVVGGAGKAGDAQQEKKQVLKNCMRGRGYRVLN